MFSKLFSIFSTNNTSYKKTDMKDMHYYIKSTEVQVNSPKSPLLTQSELQQIKEVLRVRIADEERMMCIYKAKARECKLGDCNEEANMFYKDATKASKKIKSLAAIQAKLKHSIITLG